VPSVCGVGGVSAPVPSQYGAAHADRPCMDGRIAGAQD